MAQRACAVVHSSGACAIEGAQAVSAQISAQMELSYSALEDRDPPRGCSELGADYRTRSEARVGADVSGNRVRPLTQPVQ